MNKLIKAIKTVVLSLLGAVLLTTTVLGFVTHETARKTGETLASPIGTAVGKFIGSIDGIKKAKEEVSKEDLTSSEPEKIIAKKMQSVFRIFPHKTVFFLPSTILSSEFLFFIKGFM